MPNRKEQIMQILIINGGPHKGGFLGKIPRTVQHKRHMVCKVFKYSRQVSLKTRYRKNYRKKIEVNDEIVNNLNKIYDTLWEKWREQLAEEA